MSFENRGGRPVVRRYALPVGGTPGPQGYLLPQTCKYLQISNESADILYLYFFEEDFDAGVNFVSLAASIGFFEGPVEAKSIWLDGDGLALDPVVIVAYCRRG